MLDRPNVCTYLPASARVAFSGVAQVRREGGREGGEGRGTRRAPFIFLLSDIFAILRLPLTTLSPSLPPSLPPPGSCDWFSADALYTGLPNTTDLSALTFPLKRTYVVFGVNQPRLKKSIYTNLMLTAVAAFEGRVGREGGRERRTYCRLHEKKAHRACIDFEPPTDLKFLEPRPEIGSAHKACHGLSVAAHTLSSKAITTMWSLALFSCS